MGTSAERIAIDITSSAQVAEVAKARSEVSALGQATQQSMDLASESTKKLTGTLDLHRQAQAQAQATGRTYLEVLRELVVGQQQVATAVQQTQAAVVEQTATVREATTAFEGFGYRGRTAMVGALFALDAFTRSESAGEGAMRRVLRSLSVLSFTLGPEVGIPVAGATALGDALVDMWARSEKAAASAQVQFEKTLETISRGTLVQAAQNQQFLFSGDPFARRGAVPGETDAAFAARSRGLQGLLELQDENNAKLAEWNRLTNNGTTATTQQKLARDPLVAQQKELNDLLRVQAQRMTESEAVTGALTKKQQEMAAFELKQWQDRENRRRSTTPTLPVTMEELRAGGRGRSNMLDPRNLGNIGAGTPEALTMLQELRGRELELEVQLHRTNLAYGERLRLQHELAQTQGEIGTFGRVDTSKIGRGPRAATITPTDWEVINLPILEGIDKLGNTVQRHLQTTLADSLASGITAGFRGARVKNAFAAAGQTLLSGLGGIFIDLGQTYLEYSGIMEALTPLLGDPFTAGYAGAAIGAALIGLGAALEGVAQSHRSGGAGGYAGNGGTFTPSQLASGGGTTLIVQTVNPWSREVVSATTYYINRGGMLSTPIVAPFGAPS